MKTLASIPNPARRPQLGGPSSAALGASSRRPALGVLLGRNEAFLDLG